MFINKIQVLSLHQVNYQVQEEKPIKIKRLKNADVRVNAL